MENSKPIKILMVLSQLGIGGLELQALELCRYLAKARYEVYCCPLWPILDLEVEMRKAGVKIVPIHKRYRWDFTIIPRLVYFLRKHQIDILHTWIFTANSWGRLAGLIAGTPVIIGAERNVDSWKGWIMRFIDRTLSSFTDLVVVNSGAVKNFVINEEGIDPDKVKLIYNGVDIEKYVSCRNSGEKKRARAMLGIPRDGFIIGTIASLSPRKDYPTFLKMAQQIRAVHADVHFLACGTGNLFTHIKELTHELMLDECVSLVGLQKDIPQVLAAIDIFVLVSIREGFANVILEAMAASLPIVCTDVGGNAEVVVHGKTGLVISSGKAKELAEGVIQLLEEPSAIKEMGRKGRMNVINRFSLSSMTRSYDQLYLEIYFHKQINQ